MNDKTYHISTLVKDLKVKTVAMVAYGVDAESRAAALQKQDAVIKYLVDQYGAVVDKGELEIPDVLTIRRMVGIPANDPTKKIPATQILDLDGRSVPTVKVYGAGLRLGFTANGEPFIMSSAYPTFAAVTYGPLDTEADDFEIEN